MNLTVSLAGEPLLRLVDPPGAVQAAVRRELGHLVGGDAPAGVQLVFRATRPAPPATVLSTAGVTVALSSDQRPYLLDGAGRAAELPVAAAPVELAVDPQLDPAPRRALVQVLHRLLEWQAHERRMVLVKGSSAVVGGRGVAIVGFAGSGKSSILLSLLAGASCYLSDERLVLVGTATVAALPSPVRLAMDRHSDDQVRSLIDSRTTRAGLRLARHARRLPRPVPVVVGKVLADRWVTIDPHRAFPHLERRPDAPLDDVFFLLPGADPPGHVERLSPSTTEAMVAAQARYLAAQFLGPLRAMIEFGSSQRRPWPVAAAAEEARDAVAERLVGVQGWAVHVPAGQGAGASASLIRGCLGLA